MKLMCTYIETENFEKSLDFYKKILKKEPVIFCEDRWIEFECGNKIALYNKKFDEKKIKEDSDIFNNYNKAYIDEFNLEKTDKKNNIVTFNFYTANLKEEYTRIKNLNLGNLSEIMYVNIIEPYYYFNILDPDGNILEICSDSYE